MAQTSNYGLKQWESWERVTRGEVNGNLSIIDSHLKAASDTAKEKCRMASGKYTGDGTASQFISLGFPPKAVLVEQTNGVRAHTVDANCSGGLAVNEGPLEHERTGDEAVWLSGDGFFVSADGRTYLNASGNVCYYIAFG